MKLRHLILLAAAPILAGCSIGPSGAVRQSVISAMASNDYEKAYNQIEGAKTGEYGKKNAVLFYLDAGMVLQDAGQYKKSDQYFDFAEQRMEELYTKSITKTAGMFLLNDGTVDYAGEPHERVLNNVFRSLNYVYMGDLENALVESRKVTSFLMRYRDYMQDKAGYKDDAFAQYLSGMLFEEYGKSDDARISYDDASRAYVDYAKYFNTSAPKFYLPRYGDLKDSGEIVLLHYNGPAPRKKSKTIQVAWNKAILCVSGEFNDKEEQTSFNNALRAGITGNNITVAFPEYVQDKYNIAGSQFVVDGKAADTQLVENVSAIAMRALDDRMAAISTRAIARATIKFVLSQQINKKMDQNSEMLGIFSKVLTGAVSAATEVADTRAWNTLPAQIRMARMAVQPGTHDVNIRFTDASGALVSETVIPGVKVEKGRRTYLHIRSMK